MYPTALAYIEASAALLLAHDPEERQRRREKSRKRSESGARRTKLNIYNCYNEPLFYITSLLPAPPEVLLRAAIPHAQEEFIVFQQPFVLI
jgi:hypothetical protein